MLCCQHTEFISREGNNHAKYVSFNEPVCYVTPLPRVLLVIMTILHVVKCNSQDAKYQICIS